MYPSGDAVAPPVCSLPRTFPRVPGRSTVTKSAARRRHSLVEALSDRCTVALIPKGAPLPRSQPCMSTSSSPPKPPRPVPKVDEAIRAETELNGSERILVGSVWARPPLAHYFPREKPRL